MINKTFRKLTYLLVSIFCASGSLSAATEYEIQDIGTLQTHSSRPIALNNQSEILGVYNLDGSKDGECVFLRDKEGYFSELPSIVDGISVNWEYLTNNSTVYGTYRAGHYTTLFMWDQENGAVNLGNLPGKEISAIIDAGQVLIKHVSERVNGESISYPVIWNNGEITKLEGLVGEGGIPSDAATGLDLNNHGDVVGHSVVYKIYKNNLYKQTHATKWVNGQAIDLHETVPKTDSTSASVINDLGELIVGAYLVDQDGNMTPSGNYSSFKMTDSRYVYNQNQLYNKNLELVLANGHIHAAMMKDRESIWLSCVKFVDINDNGVIIAEGKTIYGEEHALLLFPVDAE